MELFNFYSLDECLEQKLVKKKLNQLEEDGKIEFSIDGDILKIQDLDLDEEELSDLITMIFSLILIIKKDLKMMMMILVMMILMMSNKIIND